MFNIKIKSLKTLFNENIVYVLYRLYQSKNNYTILQ